MTRNAGTLSDEIIRMVTINKSVINGLRQGYILFRSHQGRLVEVTSSETLRLSSGVQLSSLKLTSDEAKMTD
jgi:hypothetical protein